MTQRPHTDSAFATGALCSRLSYRLRALIQALQAIAPELRVCIEYQDHNGRVRRARSKGVLKSNENRLSQVEPIYGSDGGKLGELLIEPFSVSKRMLRAVARLAGTTIEHNTIENALSLNEQKYRALYEDNPSMFFTLDAQGTVLSANRYGAEQLGYASEELEETSVTELFHPDDREAIAHQLSQCVRDPGHLRHWEARKLCRDGSVMWVREAARAVICPDASLCVYVVCQDISDRVNAELQVRRHQAELAHVTRLATMGEMASGLAHEINQPLYAIGNYAEAALARLENVAASEELVSSLKSVAEQAARASEIVRRMRYFARKPSAARSPTDINQVVRNAVRLIAGDAEKEGVQISLRLARNLASVDLDGLQIEQILLNLLRNALEAMRGCNEQGRILVSTRAAKDGIRIAVRDTGPGVDRHRFAEIFDPFVTTKPDGLGMGLSICRTLVEAHDGRLWVESRPGHGATFRFLLPYERS